MTARLLVSRVVIRAENSACRNAVYVIRLVRELRTAEVIVHGHIGKQEPG